jgi:Ca2+-binding RTX toxin-like protein
MATIPGTPGADNLIGTIESDLIDALAGNDTIRGSQGNDTINGGVGVDTVDYSNLGGPVTLLAQGSISKGSLGTDQISEVERIVGAAEQTNAIDGTISGGGPASFDVDLSANRLIVNNVSGLGNATFTVENFVNVTGTSNADTIVGSSSNNILNGGAGDDILNSGIGNDRHSGCIDNDRLVENSGNDVLSGAKGSNALAGGDGNDTLTGGAESDRLVFNTGASFSSAIGVDRINDLLSNDRIVLGKNTFTALTSDPGTGFSVENEFSVVGNDAEVNASNGFIVYSSTTGNLFYNQNGVADGLGEGGQFATLANLAPLTAGNFTIVA